MNWSTSSKAVRAMLAAGIVALAFSAIGLLGWGVTSGEDMAVYVTFGTATFLFFTFMVYDLFLS